MSNNFLILGLPRSRTAWLANFMTSGDMICTHEGLNGCNTLEEYRAKFTKNSGDSNTGLALFNFKPLFPDSKIVVIDSDIKASVEFAKKNYGGDTTLAMVAAKKRLDTMGGLHINLADINDRLEEIWTYLSPQPFDKKRADMLIGFDIQVRDVHDFDLTAFKNLRENSDDYFPS